MTALTDALRALALHQDLPECAQAADEIERLRQHVRYLHRPKFNAPGSDGLGYWSCSAGCRHVTSEDSRIDWKRDYDSQAHPSFAAHVEAFLDGTLPWDDEGLNRWHASHLWPDGHPNKGHDCPRAEVWGDHGVSS